MTFRGLTNYSPPRPLAGKQHNFAGKHQIEAFIHATTPYSGATFQGTLALDDLLAFPSNPGKLILFGM